MKYSDIAYMPLINSVDEDKVRQIASSIQENGFTGCPILIYSDELLTGSHRLAALRYLEETTDLDMDELGDVAEDVTGIVEENRAKREEEGGWCPDIDYSDIGWMLTGSWVEEYRDEISEW